MACTDEEIKNIVLYLFLHKWLSIRYTEANAKLLFDAIKENLYGIPQPKVKEKDES